MNHPATHLAIDLGAESGRAMLGRFDGERLTVEELHRFPNEPVLLPEGLRWDAPRLFREIMSSIGKASQTARLGGIAVDTWGVDFGLLDRDGALLGLPVHYRDARTSGILRRAFARMDRAQLWAATGCQPIPFTTLNQLLAAEGSAQRQAAATLLMLPDLVSYWLSGERGTERTIASTSGLTTPGATNWADEVLAGFAIDPALLCPLSDPGTRRGTLRPDLAASIGLSAGLPVFSTASHDTAAAWAAATTAANDALVISAGTWSLVGTELARPILDSAADAAGFTNEAGVGGTVRFLRGIAGLWLIQECRRAWARSGGTASYDELTAAASQAPAFGPLIDPSHTDFLAPRHMPSAIANRCRATGQSVPSDPGATIRCALESLALAYRAVLVQTEELTGRRLSAIHILGGGARNRLHCQLTADATGLPVVAGPVEATAIGNLLVQLIATGDVADLPELRQIVEQSVTLDRYEPTRDRQPWDDAWNRYLAIRENVA